MASFGSGFAQGLSAGSGLVKQVQDAQYQEQRRKREQQQWAREDAEREQIRALGADVASGGGIEEGSDNSYDVAEGKRMGLDVKSTIKRKKMSDVDIENRYGQIALDAGKMDQYMASRQRAKAFEREEADKVFGAKMQKLAQGDKATLAEFAEEWNNDKTTPGMVTLLKGQPHYVNPKTGMPEPIGYPEMAQIIAAGHAAGQGDWKTGTSMLLEGQRHRQQRADKEQELGFMGRRVANDEAQTVNQRAFQDGQLDLGRGRLAVDQGQLAEQRRSNMAREGIAGREASAKAAAYNNMGKFGPTVQGVDAQGNPVPMVTVMGRNGEVSYQQIPLPPGVNFQRQVDPKMVDGIAARLEGTPTGRTINGKPELYTPETAYDAALSRAQRFQPGGAPNPTRQDADAVVNYLRSQAAGGAQKPAPAKPQGAMPGRQPTTQEERLRQMYLGGAR